MHVPVPEILQETNGRKIKHIRIALRVQPLEEIKYRTEFLAATLDIQSHQVTYECAGQEVRQVIEPRFDELAKFIRPRERRTRFYEESLDLALLDRRSQRPRYLQTYGHRGLVLIDATAELARLRVDEDRVWPREPRGHQRLFLDLDLVAERGEPVAHVFGDTRIDQ